MRKTYSIFVHASYIFLSVSLVRTVNRCMLALCRKWIIFLVWLPLGLLSSILLKFLWLDEDPSRVVQINTTVVENIANNVLRRVLPKPEVNISI